MKVHHWAHVAADCDPWTEPETFWHRTWKERFAPEYREVTMGPHRADVRLPSGLVLEFQHSSISVEEIREREEYYGRMAWIFDAATFDIRGHMQRKDPLFQGRLRSEEVSILKTTTAYTAHTTYSPTTFDATAKEYYWLRAKPTIKLCSKPYVLDLGGGYVLDVTWAKTGIRKIYGTVYTVNNFVQRVHAL